MLHTEILCWFKLQIVSGVAYVTAPTAASISDCLPDAGLKKFAFLLNAFVLIFSFPPTGLLALLFSRGPCITPLDEGTYLYHTCPVSVCMYMFVYILNIVCILHFAALELRGKSSVSVRHRHVHV